MGNKQHKQNVKVLAESIESIETYDESPISIIKEVDCPKKILLLSTKSSGKSTIMKQIKRGNKVKPLKKEYAFSIQSQCKELAIILCQMVADNESIAQLSNLSTLSHSDLPKIAEIISNIWRP